MQDEVIAKFKDHFRCDHTAAAYAPGRVEVLGNHTDYNEGFVLSAAINFGTYFLASPSENTTCRIVAADLMKEVTFDINSPAPVTEDTWANYVIGVFAGLKERAEITTGFNGMFLGNIPLGAGLSSSAALEMCTGLALCSLYKLDITEMDIVKIGQKAEHDYAGVMCGLLDQVSSMFAKENELVMTDFRSLEIQTLPIGEDIAFLMCNTKAKHALVDGEYNERREKCESASEYFKTVLDHPVAALRDVSWKEWEENADNMNPLDAKRSAHPIGETERVIKGKELLDAGDISGFGKLMFDSHDSSANYFENSCPELDTIVEAAKEIPGVFGARLSGGGFGGSVVALINPRDEETVSHAINVVYKNTYGHPCDISMIKPSAGAYTIA